MCSPFSVAIETSTKPSSPTASGDPLAPPRVYWSSRWLPTDQFNSEALIAGIGAPVMIVHGMADNNVPLAEARRLYAAARQPKSIVEVEDAGHLSAWESRARERPSKRSSGGQRPTPAAPHTMTG